LCEPLVAKIEASPRDKKSQFLERLFRPAIEGESSRGTVSREVCPLKRTMQGSHPSSALTVLVGAQRGRRGRDMVPENLRGVNRINTKHEGGRGGNKALLKYLQQCWGVVKWVGDIGGCSTITPV